MKQITKDTVIAMRKDINEALKSVGEKYGVNLEAGNASYSDLECTFRLKASVKATDDFDPQKAIWDKYAPLYGLPKEAYQQQIKLDGKVYRICGIDEKARVNKILIKNESVVYKCDVATIKSALVASEVSSGKACPPDLPAASSAANTADNSEPDDFEIKAFICGLKGKCSYGQIITYQGRQYRLIGFNTKAPQYPLICTDLSSGKSYRLPKTALDT